MRAATAAAWSSLAPSLARAPAASPPRCCAATPAAADTVALAVAAALVLNTPGSAGAAALSDAALAAYCAAKGAREAAAYAAAVRAAREPWDGRAPKARARLLHQVCNGEGDATYVDPTTGYTVFAAIAHLRRGSCCGVPEGGGEHERTHRCRHCPYAPDGRLSSPAYIRLKERIPQVDAVRKGTAALYGASVRAHGSAEEDEGEAADDGERCDECDGRREAECRRCKGYAFLISPETMLCPQCDATGSHPCMKCTAWEPPQRTEFDS
jgi:Family of unknown function (DUF5522)